MRLKVLSFNIHKGFSLFNGQFTLPRLREALRRVQPDVVCLQEVTGENQLHSQEIPDFPDGGHYEYLADTVWSDFAYGKNAIYSHGHHGNAILSRFPITQSQNHDLSVNRFEQRGLLVATLSTPGGEITCANTHLNLLESDRRKQYERMVQILAPVAGPLLVCGDFNDWMGRAQTQLADKLTLSEAFKVRRGKTAATFPAHVPLLRLDRIYTRGLVVQEVTDYRGPDWWALSDHLPIGAELEL